MARVSTNISRRKFPIGAPTVPISRGDISALTAEQRAKGQFAEVVGIISASEGRRIMQADQKAQNIAGEAAMKAQMLALWDSFDTNPNEDEYKPAYEQTLKGLDEIIKNTTNANSKRDLEQFKQRNIPFWESSLRDVILDRKRTNAYARRDKSIAEIKDMDLSDAAEYYEANNRIGEGGAMMRLDGQSQEQIDNWMMDALKVVENQKVYNEAQNVSQEKGYEAAVKWVMSQKIETDAKKRIISDINFEAAQQQDQLEIQREKDRDEISKIIRLGQSATSRIESSYLDEKEQWTWFERERAESERRAKGEAIATNNLVKGEVEAMAYDISTGVVTMPEFKQRLVEERYTNKTIDDSDYDELISLAERKFESYQAQAMKERELHALGQLVTLPSEEAFAEMLARLTSKFDRQQAQSLRQLQLDNHDRYKKALRDWQKNNPEATGDEVYTEGRKLLKHFIKSPERLRTEEKERQTAYPEIQPDILEAAKIVTGGKEKELPQPKTKAEYDELPSGTRYIAPDGIERIKK